MADDAPQRTLSRVTEIGRVATRHGFGYLLDRRRSGDGEQEGDRGRRLREMFDELGPTFVKFGQLLSTRPDVVPPDIITELRKLQDDVSPVPMDDVERVIEEELGLTVEQAFLDFDETPIAAASIGQVHRATLPNDVDVVVKVQRPNAARQIVGDLLDRLDAHRRPADAGEEQLGDGPRLVGGLGAHRAHSTVVAERQPQTTAEPGRARSG